jgi:hypothetical protein
MARNSRIALIKKNLKNKTNTTKELSSLEQLQKTNSNYKTRLQASGLDPEDLTDDRNVIEKALNLEQNQGLIRDLLELLDRPRNALFTGIDYALEGKDFGKGLGKGITGEKDTSGKDLLVKHAGMKDREGKLDWSDVLGMGLEIVGDPLDYLAAPIGIASKAKTATKAIDTATDVAKAVDTATDVAKPVYKGIKGSIANMLNAATPNVTWAPANQAVMNYLGKGIKKGAKIADKGVEAALGFLDNKNLKKVDDLVAQGLSRNEALKRVGASIDKLETYQNAKKRISTALDSSKAVGGFVGKAREADDLKELTLQYGQTTANEINKRAQNIAKNYKEIDLLKDLGSEEEAYKTILNNLTHATEASKDWSYTGKELINDLVENKNVYVYNKDVANNIVSKLKEYGIDAEITNGNKVKLLGNKRKLYAIQDSLNDLNFGQKISSNAKATQQAALNLFGSNDELSSLYDYAKSKPKEIAGLTDLATGTRTGEKITEDYVTHNLNKDLPRSVTSTVGRRKYQIPVAEVNEMKRLEALEEASTLAKKGKGAAEGIFKTDEAGNFIAKNGKKYTINNAGQFTDLKGNPVNLDEINLVRSDNTFNTMVSRKNQNINRFQKELASHEELSKAKTESGYLDINKVNRESLSPKDAKIYDNIKANNELAEHTRSLRQYNFDDINVPNADEVINTTRDAYKKYAKSVTEYGNILKKKNATDDMINVARTTMNNNKKLLTAQMAEVRALSNKKTTAIFKNANKAFKEGRALGIELSKSESRLKKSDALTKTIFDSLDDVSNGLRSKLKYEQDSLTQLTKNANEIKDSIFKKKLNTIKQVAEDYATLSSPEAQEFFKESFTENLVEFSKRNANVGAAANKINSAIASGTLTNPEYVKTIEEVTDQFGKTKIPYGFQQISGTYIKNKYEKLLNVLPESSRKAVMETLKELEGKTLVMDKDLLNALNLGSKVQQETHPFMKIINNMNNTFKKFSTLTAGFQVRNMTGNSLNMVLSGMPASQIIPYYEKAMTIWNNADDLIQKAVKGTLTDLEKKQFDVLQDFYKAGFAEAFTKGQGLEAIKEGGKGPIKWLSQKSVEANEIVDRYNRFALLTYAKDHPDYVRRLGQKNAIDAVKFALFDPSNMSDVEKNVIKKVIPFYTFTKQNLMFQANNLMKNTGKYVKLYRFLENTYNDLPEDSYYDYQKSNMQIPLPFTGSDGNQLFLKANLPVSDLEEYLSNPIQRTLASTSPLIKTPVELVTGKSLYTGEDANYKVLSNTLNKMGISNKGLEDSAQAAETILNGFGLQNVSTNLIKKVQAILERNNEGKSRQALWAEIFRSVIQNTNQENVRKSNLYDELEAYQAEVKRLKNQGIDIPTIKEITAKNNITLNNAKRKRASLR